MFFHIFLFKARCFIYLGSEIIDVYALEFLGIYQVPNYRRHRKPVELEIEYQGSRWYRSITASGWWKAPGTTIIPTSNWTYVVQQSSISQTSSISIGWREIRKTRQSLLASLSSSTLCLYNFVVSIDCFRRISKVMLHQTINVYPSLMR